MNWTWIIVGSVIWVIGSVIIGAGWNWDKWHKKNDEAPKKMEQTINSSPNSTAYQAGRDIKR
jgi:hypothetical protein